MTNRKVLKDMYKALLNEFSREHSIPSVSYDIDLVPLHDIYTKSIAYYKWVYTYHEQKEVWDFIGNEINSLPAGSKVIDIGTCGGVTGLEFALAGKDFEVTFHDFEGVGLQFIEWALNKLNVKGRILPYENSSMVENEYDLAIATDVLEHTGNHLGFLRWLEIIGKRVAICFPYTAPFHPPHKTVLDEWVDLRAIITVINSRYTDIESATHKGRAYFAYPTNRDPGPGLHLVYK